MMIEIRPPDELAQRAQRAGLLSDDAVRQLLEEAMRRQAGRALVGEVRRLQAADIPPMSDEEIQAEVDAVRVPRRQRG